MKIFAVLSLASASAIAAPDATKPAPTPAPRPAGQAVCKPSGTPLFEIDHKADAGAKLATSSVKVYNNGAWVHDETDADGKALAAKTGCYAKNDVAKLTTALSDTEWKVTTAKIHCMAVSSTFTVYLVRGKEVFTRKLCSGQDLDEKSRTKLQAAIAQVEGTVPATP